VARIKNVKKRFFTSMHYRHCLMALLAYMWR